MLNTKNLVKCGMFTALIAIGAFIQIPISAYDYFTLQNLFVLLAGMLLGAKLGAFSVICYVVLGLVGFPIFAAGGGISYVLRPTFGYLLGFILTAYVTGKLSQGKTSIKALFIAAIVGMVLTYAVGFGYKYMIMNWYLNQQTLFSAIFAASMTLDIPGDIVLSFVAAIVAKRVKKELKVG